MLTPKLPDGTPAPMHVHEFDIGYLVYATVPPTTDWMNRLLLLSEFPFRSDEGRDARRSVKAWAREIDPEATASFSWQGALDGDLDSL